VNVNGTAATFPLWKRGMDIAFSVTGLIITLPLFLVIAAIIKITSPGPAFLRQERIGRFGKKFFLWKFRTMRTGVNTASHEAHLKRLIAADTPMVKLDSKNDPRVFPFGRILRSTCLDEMPQLINVLLGEMSLVGPRPCLFYEFQQYQDWQKRRFDAMPGLTGLWQVSGKNRTTFTEMVGFDIAYAERVSLMSDLKIILRTIPAIVSDLTAGAERKDITQVKRAA
jgi:lipopolysaccharide/colanic/teichoic acid biosynthesis glycosyltransferase